MGEFKCVKCGSTEYVTREKSNGTGIATGLYCAKCGFWHKWLNKQEKIVYGANNDAQKDSIDELKAELERVKKERDEYKHRAEIAERALLDCIKDCIPHHCNIAVCDKWTRCGDNTCIETRKTVFIEQAEREIEGEGKDE